MLAGYSSRCKKRGSTGSSAAPYIEELNDFIEKYAPWLRRISNEGQALSKRLERLVRIGEERLSSMRVELGWGAFPVCLCHVDPNSNNAILEADGRVRWIDWEYSGWGDPALDLAEYRWHIAYADLSARPASLVP